MTKKAAMGKKVEVLICEKGHHFVLAIGLQENNLPLAQTLDFRWPYHRRVVLEFLFSIPWNFYFANPSIGYVAYLTRLRL